MVRDEVVEAVGSERDAGDDRPVGVQRAGQRQHAHRLRHHAGVQLQLAMPGQRARERERHRADAELQRVPVLHEARDMRADALFDAQDARVGQLHHGHAASTHASSSDLCARNDPRVRGISGLMCATRRAARAHTSGTKSLHTPGLQKPSSSGGLSCAIATSTGAMACSGARCSRSRASSSSARPSSRPRRIDGDMKKPSDERSDGCRGSRRRRCPESAHR